MSSDIDSFSDYCKAIQRKALIELEEVEESLERDEIQMNKQEVINKTADESLESCHFLMYNQKAIINHTHNGYYGEGYERYIQDVEIEDNDPREMQRLIATAALYNDIKEVLHEIFECRESLGEAMKLLDDKIYSDGVEAVYEYEDLHENVYEFRLEHIVENEWRIFDPNGDLFEVISPDVYIADNQSKIPVKALNIWLDNICARRMNELKNE